MRLIDTRDCRKNIPARRIDARRCRKDISLRLMVARRCRIIIAGGLIDAGRRRKEFQFRLMDVGLHRKHIPTRRIDARCYRKDVRLRLIDAGDCRSNIPGHRIDVPDRRTSSSANPIEPWNPPEEHICAQPVDQAEQPIDIYRHLIDARNSLKAIPAFHLVLQQCNLRPGTRVQPHVTALSIDLARSAPRSQLG